MFRSTTARITSHPIKAYTQCTVVYQPCSHKVLLLLYLSKMLWAFGRPDQVHYWSWCKWSSCIYFYMDYHLGSAAQSHTCFQCSEFRFQCCFDGKTNWMPTRACTKTEPMSASKRAARLRQCIHEMMYCIILSNRYMVDILFAENSHFSKHWLKKKNFSKHWLKKHAAILASKSYSCMRWWSYETLWTSFVVVVVFYDQKHISLQSTRSATLPLCTLWIDAFSTKSCTLICCWCLVGIHGFVHFIVAKGKNI